MKELSLILGLIVVSSYAIADNPKFVDVAYFDTKVITELGDSSFSGKGCTIVLYGPGDGEVNSNTIQGKSCRSIVQNSSAALSERGVGITSITVNGVETLKGIKNAN